MKQILLVSFLFCGGNLVEGFRANRPPLHPSVSSFRPLQFRGGAQSTTALDGVQLEPVRNKEQAKGVPTSTTMTETTTTTITTRTTTRRITRSTWITGTGIIVAWLLFQQRDIWLPFLNKDLILQQTLDLLKPLQSNPNGWLYYSMGLACWEFCGLSTIPVETAAGMVLGWKAAAASLLGKFTGAMVAFAVGRWCLYQHIATQLQHNELFQLINQASTPSSITTVTTASKSTSPAISPTFTTPHPHSPLLTAFLMKFSCFPEMVKNFGSSLVPVIQWWMFAVATLVHGGIFTVLWTWVGQQTKGGMSSGATTVALGIAAFMGLVVTPVVMAWWIRDLKQWADLQQQQAAVIQTKRWQWRKKSQVRVQ